MIIKHAAGATLLDEETLKGLIPGLTLQRELDEFEAQNIATAMLWARRSRILKKNLISASGLYLLHKKMFDQTWEWAGTTRKLQMNIGVSPAKIQTDLAILLGDIKYWLENKTYSLEEIAIRFHHKLVWIHPFPNGNGRFSRLATNLFLEFNGEEKFTWSSENLSSDGKTRQEYINALKVADKDQKYSALLKFAKGR